MSESEAELERVTVRFRGLTIDIARDSGSRGSLGSYDLVGETGARTETGPLEGSSAARLRSLLWATDWPAAPRLVISTMWLLGVC